MTPGSLCVSSYYEFEALGESPEVGSQPATSFKTRGGTPNPPLGIAPALSEGFGVKSHPNSWGEQRGGCWSGSMRAPRPR